MRKLLAFVLFFSSLSFSQAARVGSPVAGTTNTQTTTPVALTISGTAGNDMICGGQQQAGAVGIMTIADSTAGSNTWSKIYDATDATSTVQCVIWRTNLAANITSVSIGSSGTHAKGAMCQQYSGIPASPTVVSSTYLGSATGATWATNAFSPAASSVGFACAGNALGVAMTLTTANWTMTDASAVGDGDTYKFIDSIVVAAGSQTVGGGITSGSRRAAGAVAIQYGVPVSVNIGIKGKVGFKGEIGIK